MSSFEELKARIDRAAAFVEAIPPEQLEAAAECPIQLKFRSVTGRMDGHAHLTKFLLPDFYFHIAIAHGIFRQNGLGIGKADYLGRPWRPCRLEAAAVRQSGHAAPTPKKQAVL
jgi:hypothetical protein